MEFGEKIKKLRAQKNMTQEQLAEKLYVSRTAVSKWESGRGYPSIDSLKDVASLFQVSVDELLSSEEIIVIAKKENQSVIKRIGRLVFGFFDVIAILFIFLPIYAKEVDGFVYSVPLLSTSDIGTGIKVSYIVILSILSLIGVAELVLNFVRCKKIQTSLSIMSAALQAASVLFFAISRQSYLTSIVFVLLLFKILLWAKITANNARCK